MITAVVPRSVLTIFGIFLPTILMTMRDSLAQGDEGTCYNAEGQFNYKKAPYTCLDVKDDKSLCYKGKKFMRKCPVTCGECNCEDNPVRFYSIVKGNINCRKVARKSKFHCKDATVRMNCPVSCGMCHDDISEVALPPTPSIECSIQAELGYQLDLTKSLTESHSASLAVSKKGEIDECVDGITSWGCMHSGKASIINGLTASENVHIINGKDGKFNLMTSHDQLTVDDTFLPSTITISVNDKDISQIVHDTNVDLAITLDCDSYCNCIVEEKTACALHAELNFPDKPEYVGYHRLDVEASRPGSNELCNQASTSETDWGCIHSGVAAIWKPENPEYYSYNHIETVDISNMFGEEIFINVQHHFSDYEKYYDSDHSIQGILSVYVNDELMGEYSHPKNRNIDTHLRDGSINPSYKGAFLVTVNCDNYCNCDVTKKNILPLGIV